MRLTLSDSEMFLTLAVLSADNTPWMSDSPLLTLSRPELDRQLQTGRERALQRGLMLAREGGALTLQPDARSLIEGARRPQDAFELMHTAHGQPPRRIQFCLGGQSPIMHEFLAGGGHAFQTLPAPDDVVNTITHIAAPAESLRELALAPVVVPYSTFVALAKTAEGDSAGLLEKAFAQAKAPKPVADALLQAGLHPLQQTVLTQLGVREKGFYVRSLVWFADNASCWLVRDFKRDGSIEIAAAGRSTIVLSIQAFVASRP